MTNPTNRMPDPTRKQIEKRAARIRATWSELEVLRRLGLKEPERWTPPRAAGVHVTAEFGEE